jgi:fatty-acyl-CoA synthase
VTLRTLPEALVEAARSDAGLTIIEHDGRTIELPYHELLRESLRLGGGLRAHGISVGDRVAVVMPEVHDFIRAFFAIAVAGAVPVPLCPPAQAGDVATFSKQSRHILTAAKVAAVVTSADVAGLLPIEPARSATIITLDALQHGSPLDTPAAVSLDDTALLQFTSGSTAAPKGVVLTHRGLASNVQAIIGIDALHVQAQHDVAVSWLPLYHDMGLIGMLLSSVWTPVRAVIMSPVLFLKRPSAWLEAISTHGGTISFAPNFAYELCRRRVKPSQKASFDLSRWRIAGCGAEPIRPDTLTGFAEDFAATGFRVSAFVPSYGLAEHALAVTFALDGIAVDRVDADRLVHASEALPIVDGERAVRVVCCGAPFAGHELRIVDDQFTPLPDRHVGSIVVKGPSLMSGYFDDPDATRTVMRDGWLLTGDVGYLAGGRLYVCGRTKDLIIRQGKKYHPPDIESAIADVDGLPLAGVVVFAVTHFEEPDRVVAVLEARASAQPDEVAASARRRVREAAGLELDHIVVAPPGTIPRTTSGKVRRSETRARFQAGTLTRPVAVPAER